MRLAGRFEQVRRDHWKRRNDALVSCARCQSDEDSGEHTPAHGPAPEDVGGREDGKGNPEKIRLVVKNGVTIKGMPAWENSLKEEDIYAVVAHIMRIKGTNIKDGKQPQGIKVK